MSQTNQISAAISAADLATIMENLASIKSKLSSILTINLEEDDRMGLAKMGDKTLAFVDKSLNYASQHPEIVPAFLDVAEGKKDFALASGMNAILKEVSMLHRGIEDAVMLAGNEAYEAARIFYNAVKGAAKSNVPGASAVVNDLQQRYPGNKARVRVQPEQKAA